ncbi:MAG TPA: hypothetical protein VFE62_05175 [Gemmataceae bacterium]|nr:hypothetical protein [Gemmataceae bacterium]
MIIESLLDACEVVLNEQGEPQSSFWLASQVMEMKMWRASEADVRDAISKDVARLGESSRLAGRRVMPAFVGGGKMKLAIPKTPAQWLKEIKLAIADAWEAEPFGPLAGTEITDANLFHLAPLVCLKFRGKKLKGREADRVIKVALANYVANSDPEGVDHGLKDRPLMAFTLCYVAAHLALDLVDEQEAEAILTYCEEHL